MVVISHTYDKFVGGSYGPLHFGHAFAFTVVQQIHLSTTISLAQLHIITILGTNYSFFPQADNNGIRAVTTITRNRNCKWNRIGFDGKHWCYAF